MENETRREKQARWQREWRRAHPEQRRETAKAWRRKNPRFMKSIRLKWQYGFTLAELEEAVDDRAGLCAICTEPMIPGRFTHIDHCHKTDRVRGIVCDRCNLGLGHFRDDPLLLQAAIEYLQLNSEVK